MARKLEPGSYSHGTLRMEDLTDMVETIAAILDCYGCQSLAAEMYRYVDRYASLADRMGDDAEPSPDAMDYIGIVCQRWSETFTDWDDRVNAYHVPDGHYFGTLEGDASDYGVWPIEDREPIAAELLG